MRNIKGDSSGKGNMMPDENLNLQKRNEECWKWKIYWKYILKIVTFKFLLRILICSK